MKQSKIHLLIVVAIFTAVSISLATHAAAGTLSAFGYESIALLCPLGALEVMLGGGQILWHPLILLGLMVVITLIAGKVFCGWVCPTPLLQRFIKGKKTPGEAAAKAANSTSHCKSVDCSHGCSSCSALKPIGGKRDGFHLDTRFAVLCGALASTAVFGFPVFCLVCPVGLTFATFIGLWHLFQFNEASWGLLIFPAILVLELVVLRKWCHRFCPISAVLSLIAQGNRTLRPRVAEEKCLRTRGIDCRICVDACPEELDPHAANIAECTKCGQCKVKCPAQAIRFPLLSLNSKKPERAQTNNDEGRTASISDMEEDPRFA